MMIPLQDYLPAFARLTLILAVGLLAIGLLRRVEPGWRVIAARGTLIGVIALAFLSLGGLNLELPVLTSPAVINESQDTSITRVPVTAPAPLVSETQRAVSVPAPVAEPVALSLPPIALFVIWAIVAGGLVFRRLYFLARQRQLVRSSPRAPEAWEKLWQSVCHEFGVRPTTVVTTPGNASPFLHLDGTLVLPASMTVSEPDDKTTPHVLRHECAHLRTSDPRWFVAGSLLSAALWFHPMIWLLQRLHLVASEESSDATAARIGGTNPYRASVAAIALELIPSEQPIPCLLRRRSSLLSRLSRVGDFASQRPPGSKLSLVGLAVVAGFAAITAVVTPVNAEPAGKGLVSSWRPIDLDSDYLKQIDIYEWAGEMKMKTWGSVNHGEKSSEGHVSDLPSHAANLKIGESVTVSRTFHFKVSDFTLTLLEQGLKLESTHRYTDDSGRGTRSGTHFFVRGAYPENAEASKLDPETELVEKGWGGTWRNIDDAGGAWAQLVIRDLGEMNLSIWSFMGGNISQGPVSTMKFPLAAEQAFSDSPPEEVVVSDDHGFAKYTYTITLHNDQMTIKTFTDFTDPDRADMEYEDHFMRGEFPRD